MEEEKYVSLTMALLESRINLVLMIALAFVSWGKEIRAVSPFGSRTNNSLGIL